MKAISFASFGDPDVLSLLDLREPQAATGQVRVRVRTAAVNPFDIKVRRGFLQPHLPPALPFVPGYDAAGIVDQIGPGVTDLAIGDEVLGNGFVGAYAEFAVADPAELTRKPASVDWETAGGFASVAATAARVLRQLDLQAGQTLLIHGAAGAVGRLAVQLAVAGGINVIASGGATNQEQLQALGATAVVYGEGLAERVRLVAPRIDRAFDLGGRGDLPTLIELTGTPDHVITIADPAAEAHGVRFSTGGEFGGLAPLVTKLADGQLSMVVGETFPLAEAAAAQALSESGRASGRIILHVS
ncbi:NADPH:quinone reductase-like Zn-dependent oxidoreductase [Jatrophihabitans sp. GAS493]|uniref:NADP-dependent oxidoreductase n=1 Tax=Jatrophihabitans sp. GAS493 TaxID=1907575 RepID=UPI000BB8C582|nr:NADP-dependent oxidoreductase [Jatrophihabitans sp. GAS493]SOD71243.1 NADPH:quinone reductase-like Zn-dependent oxidoreductase [Jatrophihabitans sp. GAS493]